MPPNTSLDLKSWQWVVAKRRCSCNRWLLLSSPGSNKDLMIHEPWCIPLCSSEGSRPHQPPCGGKSFWPRRFHSFRHYPKFLTIDDSWNINRLVNWEFHRLAHAEEVSVSLFLTLAVAPQQLCLESQIQTTPLIDNLLQPLDGCISYFTNTEDDCSDSTMTEHFTTVHHTDWFSCSSLWQWPTLFYFCRCAAFIAFTGRK